MEQESSLPYLLTQIPDYPKKLYIRGNFPNDSSLIFLTVIGSRKFTAYGKQVCEKIISELAGYPFVIVSGLALGIDTIAHETALKSKLLTVAVPGSGLDPQIIYPASNKNLAERIIKSGGALVSEFEPDFKATPWSFPKRNRIMAGLSHAILVIEAENISGTRITARLGTEYNREVFAVPGSIFNPMSAGCNELIREGATPITCAGDIIRYFNLDTQKENVTQKELFYSEDEQKIINLLNEPKSRNQLALDMNMPIYKLGVLISEMEIKGYIQEYLGKIQKK